MNHKGKQLSKPRITKEQLFWNHRGPLPKFQTPDQMADLIVDYFNNSMPTRIERRKVGRDEYEEIEVAVPSVWWLAYHLWFKSKSMIYDYEKKEWFWHLIGRARMLIEVEYEKLLHKNPTAAIFALKQFWWSDSWQNGSEKSADNKIVIEHVVRRIEDWEVIDSESLQKNTAWNLEHETSFIETKTQ